MAAVQGDTADQGPGHEAEDPDPGNDAVRKGPGHTAGVEVHRTVEADLDQRAEIPDPDPDLLQNPDPDPDQNRGPGHPHPQRRMDQQSKKKMWQNEL